MDAEAVAVPQSVRDAAFDLDGVLAKVAAVKDRAGETVDGIANKVGEGLDQLGSHLDDLENLDPSALVDELEQRVTDIAASCAA